MNDLPTTTVIRAVYDVRERRGEAPTANDVAEYLELGEEVVLASLRALKESRIFRDRQRKGRRVWEPWNGWEG